MNNFLRYQHTVLRNKIGEDMVEQFKEQFPERTHEDACMFLINKMAELEVKLEVMEKVNKRQIRAIDKMFAHVKEALIILDSSFSKKLSEFSDRVVDSLKAFHAVSEGISNRLASVEAWVAARASRLFPW